MGKNYLPTIGVEFATKLFRFGDGEEVKLQIWDTGTFFVFGIKKLNIIIFELAGQERYQAITSR